MTYCAPQKPARIKSFERTPPTNRGFRLAGAYGVANASVCSLRAVCGRRSIPSLSIKTDYIAEIGIDEMQRLYICPAHETFPHIYRAAMEVNWDENRKCLHSPKPREWSYVQWYVQIIQAARDEYGVKLSLSPDTRWVNIRQDLKQAILQNMGSNA